MSTIAAEITGTGRAAVATVVVSGEHAQQLVSRFFEPAHAGLRILALNRVHFGQWRWRDYCEELVVCRTGEQEIEIYCHGGRAAPRKILESLADAGTRVVSVSQWLRHAVDDWFVQDAVGMLTQVRTPKPTAICLDQSRHALRDALKELKAEILDQRLDLASARLRQLQQYANFGVRLHRPFRVVVWGVPNSGKSSLVNALVGFQRSIVFDQPGTTRDVVHVETAMDGWSLLLSDTAGIRHASDAIERQGIAQAEDQLHDADLLLSVQDVANPACAEIPQDVSGLPNLRVGTKSDLTTGTTQGLDVVTSAKTGAGIEVLAQRIVRALVPTPPPPGSAVPISERQSQLVDALLSLLSRHQVSDAIDLLETSLSKQG